MRILSVLGIAALGAGLGTMAVVAPLTTTQTSPRSDWAVNWRVFDAHEMVSLLSGVDARDTGNATGAAPAKLAAARVGADDTPTVKVTLPSRSQDRATFDVLTQQKAASSDAAGAQVALQPWTATASIAPADPASRSTRHSSKPSNDEQRTDLVRSIQVELARVGCYSGEADGQWSTSTKRAMGRFNDRLNASLPYDEPDLILLTLVKGQRGTACGITCPTGQQMTDGGLCKPSGVLAHADRPKAVHRIKDQQPQVAAVAPATDKTTSPSFGTTTVIAATESEPADQVPAQPAQAPSYGVTVRSAQPLPGRMAIGGPVPPPLPEIREPVTATPEEEVSDAPPSAPTPPQHARSHKSQHAVAAPAIAPPPVVHRYPPAIVFHRPPPPVAHPPQAYLAQPRKPRWHPNNPFWQD